MIVKRKRFTLGRDVSLSSVANVLAAFLRNQKGLTAQVIEESGGYLIKAKSPKWYSCLAGHALSARIGLERTGDTLAVTVGGARWLDKIIFWLFLIIPGFGLIIALPTAAVGTVKQLLLLKDILREISKIIPIIESGGCLEYHRIPVFARGVEPFGFDNFMFR